MDRLLLHCYQHSNNPSSFQPVSNFRLGSVQGIPQTITLPIQGWTVTQQLSGANIYIYRHLRVSRQYSQDRRNTRTLSSNGEIQTFHCHKPTETAISINAITTIPYATSMMDGQQVQLKPMQTSTFGSKGQGGEFYPQNVIDWNCSCLKKIYKCKSILVANGIHVINLFGFALKEAHSVVLWNSLNFCKAVRFSSCVSHTEEHKWVCN